ncbi:GbsR/MarR family transcriptional regulator [Microbacterium sp. CJ88]|uniref:GbsR/MarR family transcriptional regulator n=1 Tax=Microbacterium sp. CJ88 TaxID=3445672 RepID=UPI003F65FAB0
MSARDDHRAIVPAEDAAAVMAEAGMPRMPARVMMALVAAPGDGYTAAELADRLGVSAAAVSGAVRYLQQIRFIRRRSRPGERRDRYELVHETFYGSVASNSPVYERMAAHLDLIADAQHDDEAARARATEMASFFRFIAARLPGLIEEWEAAQR